MMVVLFVDDNGGDDGDSFRRKIRFPINSLLNQVMLSPSLSLSLSFSPFQLFCCFS